MTISVLMMQPQNFSIPAGYNEIITFDVNPAVTPSLHGTTIIWRVWNQLFGIPNYGAAGAPPIILKSSLDSPLKEIIGIDSPLSFTVQMYTHDTLHLLRNYYHEASIINAAGECIGGSWGVMTVVEAINLLPESPGMPVP